MINDRDDIYVHGNLDNAIKMIPYSIQCRGQALPYITIYTSIYGQYYDENCLIETRLPSVLRRVRFLLDSAWVEIWWQIVVHYNNGVRRPSSVILKYHQAFYQVPIHSSLFYHLLQYR